MKTRLFFIFVCFAICIQLVFASETLTPQQNKNQQFTTVGAGGVNTNTKNNQASTFDLIVFVIILIIGLKIFLVIRRSPFFKIFLFLLKIVGLNPVAELLRYDGDTSSSSNSSSGGQKNASRSYISSWRCCATCGQWSGSRNTNFSGEVVVESNNIVGKCGSKSGSSRGFNTHPDQCCDGYIKWSNLR